MMGFCPYIKGSLKESECHHDGYCSECPHNTRDDTISRQMAIDAVNTALFPKINTAKDAEKALRNLPSAQPEQDEWCTDCKEYDPKKHCCPRFNKVIRNALKDAQPEIIRCKDCKYYRECEIFGRKITLCKRREYDALNTEPDDFCSRAERRTNGET